MERPDYSVIVPVFNSENSLEELYSRTRDFFKEIDKRFELIFVDDNSKDKSWKVLKKIKKENPELVTAVRLAKNFGQHNATFCGLARAKGEFVITIDDDLQLPPEEIKKLIDGYEASQSDLVYGVFKDKKHNPARNISSASFNQSSKLLLKGPGKGSSFRLMTRELVNNILNHFQSFVFLDEIINWYTADISYVQVKHLPRQNDKSGYTSRKLIRLFSNIVLFYSNVPLRAMVYMGLLFSSFSFLIGIFFFIKKIFFNTPILGYTSLIVIITFSTGIIIFSLGILGGYISRIYFAQNKKPPYSIKKVL
ncbi:MAG: glycosyltransferase family 2 protein [Bacteroidales bacterium]|nr:glycosyltransferase family 2 protein [Bacteroidales bacterium]MCF8386778.1 glycosyltransferase family 2 protein [Bacteroidales bacterium]MCF8398225.1 glycosyltransferase family 2 protein [Bacteroidales bacterium]